MPDESSPSVAPDAPTPAPTAEHTLGATLRTIAIGASFGAAVIHFALAPAHLDERTADGVFFLLVAWAQVAVAAALYRWRDRREPWLGALAVHAGVLVVWLGSRTIGFPESHHSSIGFPDTLAAALEATVVLAAVANLVGSVARRPSPAVNPIAFGVAGLALAGLVSASVTPSWAGEAAGHGHDEAAAGGHAHGDTASADGSHAHGAGNVQQVADSERCDLGFNTAAYNDAAVPGMPHAHDDGTPVDFTLEEWAEVFVNPDNGATPAQVVGYIEDQPTMRDGILTGGLTHTLDPDPWNALTDEEECAQLADELDRAKQVAATYPTVADAEAAGYRMVTTYLPGIAAHYIKPQNFADGFVLEEPEMLLYDGTDAESNVVGLSYYVFKDGDTEPAEGFTGDNDHYHRHTGLCLADGVVVGGTNTTDEQCAELGGSKADGTAGWMSHVWVVPGCESDWGVFSGANPALEVRTGQAQWESGCGTGKTLDDPLDFETGGNGPQELAAG